MKKQNLLKAISTSVILLMTSAASASVAVLFDEGAPKDRFSIINNSNCAVQNAGFLLDLSGSKSGLIFDVTSKGAGVEVFQPLEFVSGQNYIKKTPTVEDGDNQIRFEISDLPAGKSISFTIDVDDTAGGREITVEGSEIAKSSSTISLQSMSYTGIFDNTARTSITIPDNC